MCRAKLAVSRSRATGSWAAVKMVERRNSAVAGSSQAPRNVRTSAFTDRYRDAIYHGGIFSMGFLQLLDRRQHPGQRDHRHRRHLPAGWSRHRPDGLASIIRSTASSGTSAAQGVRHAPPGRRDAATIAVGDPRLAQGQPPRLGCGPERAAALARTLGRCDRDHPDPYLGHRWPTTD
jgi:hypothetical protein